MATVKDIVQGAGGRSGKVERAEAAIADFLGRLRAR